MDALQLALIFLVILLAGFLSILGIQVFFILSELKKSLQKLEKFISEVETVGEEVAQVSKVIGSRVVSQTKPQSTAQTENAVRRLFKKRVKL